MIPLSFAFWLLMQKGMITLLLTLLFGEVNYFDYRMVNIVVASISFFGFLLGVYCLAFSREKIEDEMVQKIRMDSFQFAALIQLPLIICGFFSLLIPGNTKEQEVIILVLAAALIVFWFGFITRFHYMLHVKLK